MHSDIVVEMENEAIGCEIAMPITSVTVVVNHLQPSLDKTDS